MTALAPVGELDADFPMVLDPKKPMIVSAWGAKGSGKSVLNRWIYTGYPGDKLAIDVNGHAAPGEDAEKLTTADLRPHWPTPMTMPGERRRPRNLHYVADPGSPSYADDLDRAVGMALFPKDHRTLVWAGEVGEMMPHGKPGPHMRRLLQQNRHYRITGLFDGPRPVWVDPLILMQSDFVAVYRLPQAADRKRIAEVIGYPAARFDAECHETWRRGKYHFLLWHTEASKLYRCPPLPIDVTGNDAGRFDSEPMHVSSERLDRPRELTA